MKKVNITIQEKDLQEIKEFAISKDMKLSSIFRKGAKELIENERKWNQ